MKNEKWEIFLYWGKYFPCENQKLRAIKALWHSYVLWEPAIMVWHADDLVSVVRHLQLSKSIKKWHSNYFTNSNYLTNKTTNEILLELCIRTQKLALICPFTWEFNRLISHSALITPASITIGHYFDQIGH